MNRPLTAMIVAGLSLSAVAGAPPATAPAGLDALRTDLTDSFVKHDVPRLLSHLDDDVVVTFQDGEVCHGPAAVRAYYDKMMTGPHPIVAAVHADPQVTDRQVYGDWAVSVGRMHDTFDLTDGTSFALDSHFTATTVRRGDQWKVAAFHLSADAFDNAIIRYAARKSATYAGLAAGVGGLVVGGVAGLLLGRRRRRQGTT